MVAVIQDNGPNLSRLGSLYKEIGADIQGWRVAEIKREQGIRLLPLIADNSQNTQTCNNLIEALFLCLPKSLTIVSHIHRQLRLPPEMENIPAVLAENFSSPPWSCGWRGRKVVDG